MSTHHPSYDLNALIQRLKLVQNQEIIHQFHSFLDLIDQSKGQGKESFSGPKDALFTKIDAAEKSIKAGTTMPQDEFRNEVKAWIAEKRT